VVPIIKETPDYSVRVAARGRPSIGFTIQPT
jgi:hypothetical protein